MTTSALALQQLMAVASSAKDQKMPFLRVLADHLGLEGDDACARAVGLLLRIIGEIETDIAYLSVDEKHKTHLRNQVAPYNSVKNMAHVSMDVVNAKRHFLKPDHLVGLTNIHLALQGNVNRPSLPRSDAEALAEDYRKIAAKIQKVDLPDDLRMILLRRTLKIASILEHFYAFGADEMREELEGLVGAMVLTKGSAKGEQKSLYSSLATLALASLGMLTAFDAGLGKALSIYDKGDRLIEIIANDEE